MVKQGAADGAMMMKSSQSPKKSTSALPMTIGNSPQRELNDRLVKLEAEKRDMQEKYREASDKLTRLQERIVELEEQQNAGSLYSQYLTSVLPSQGSAGSTVVPKQAVSQGAAEENGGDTNEAGVSPEPVTTDLTVQPEQSPDSNETEETDKRKIDENTSTEIQSLKAEIERLLKLDSENAERMAGIKSDAQQKLSEVDNSHKDESKKLQGRIDQLEEKLQASEKKNSRLESEFTRLKKKTDNLIKAETTKTPPTPNRVWKERETELRTELRNERTQNLNLKEKLKELEGEILSLKEDLESKDGALKRLASAGFVPDEAPNSSKDGENSKSGKALGLSVKNFARLKKQRKALSKEQKLLKADLTNMTKETQKNLSEVGQSLKRLVSVPATSSANSAESADSGIEEKMMKLEWEGNMQLATSMDELEQMYHILNALRKENCLCGTRESDSPSEKEQKIVKNSLLKEKIEELEAQIERLTETKSRQFQGAKSTDPGTYNRLIKLCQQLKNQNSQLKRQLFAEQAHRTQQVLPNLLRLSALKEALNTPGPSNAGME